MSSGRRARSRCMSGCNAQVRVLWTRRGFDIDGDWAGASVSDDLGDNGRGGRIVGAVDELDIEGRQEFEGGAIAFGAAEMREGGLAVRAEEGDDVGRHTVNAPDIDPGSGQPEDASSLVGFGEGALDSH